MLYIQPTKNEMIHMLLNDEFANWSYDGASALIDYLEQLAEDTGEDIEFNPIECRCYYNEYSNWDDLKADYRDHSEEYIRAYVIAEGEGYIITQQF